MARGLLSRDINLRHTATATTTKIHVSFYTMNSMTAKIDVISIVPNPHLISSTIYECMDMKIRG